MPTPWGHASRGGRLPPPVRAGSGSSATGPMTAFAEIRDRRAGERRATAAPRFSTDVQAPEGERLSPAPIGTASPAEAPPGHGSSRPRPSTARSRRAWSPLEVQDRVHARPENLPDLLGASRTLLAPDDEWLTGAEIEDREHRTPAQRISLAHLGHAIKAPPARPDAEDPARAGRMTHLELDLVAHSKVLI